MVFIFKYNLIPHSLNRVTGDIHEKKVILNDGEADYSFTIDKELKPKNEWVLLRHKKTGKYELKKIEVSRSLRYDRNIKKTASPGKSFLESPKAPEVISPGVTYGSFLTPSLDPIEDREIVSPTRSYSPVPVVKVEPPQDANTDKPIENEKKITVNPKHSSSFSLEQAIFGAELEEELDLVLADQVEDEDDSDSTLKSLNSMYND